jgi:GH43 family beta-xylosidase
MNKIAVQTFSRGCTLVLLSTLSLGAWAQTVHQIDVERATVIYVSGNDLVVKSEDGLVRHFVVPSDAKAYVDGKEVSVHDLKSGTKLTRTITTTSQEQLVSEVRTVDLKVLEVKPPYLTVASGDKIKHLKVPERTKFTIDGKEMALSDLKADMRIKGTVVTTTPTTVMAKTKTVTGQAPTKVVTPVLIGVLLIEEP